MSMSQEEIEALMNGLDIADDASDSSAENQNDTSVSPDEIDDLISNVEEENTVEQSIEVQEPVQTEEVNSVEASNEVVNNDDIDDLLKGLEETNSAEPAVEEDNFDDILSQIDNVVEEPVKEEAINLSQPSEQQEQLAANSGISSKDKDEIVRDWTDTKINEGVIPLPAEKDTKVVNQLNQVANDSEEKVGQIFDVLSLSLDNNNDCRNKINSFETFLNSQTNLLNSLHSKFPNISVFENNLSEIQKVSDDLNALKSSMNDEDMKIFEAMELMQFNDINRQKIERVMAVIRKLSLYLNNLFEDEDNGKEIVVAKHIHGDTNNDLIGDDLDKLIAEFGN